MSASAASEGPASPLFFDETTDSPTPLSEADFEQVLTEALELAAVDRAFIYAVQHTGIMPIEGHDLSAKAVRRFKAAMRRYNFLRPEAERDTNEVMHAFIVDMVHNHRERIGEFAASITRLILQPEDHREIRHPMLADLAGRISNVDPDGIATSLLFAQLMYWAVASRDQASDDQRAAIVQEAARFAEGFEIEGVADLVLDLRGLMGVATTSRTFGEVMDQDNAHDLTITLAMWSYVRACVMVLGDGDVALLHEFGGPDGPLTETSMEPFLLRDPASRGVQKD
jgi:hypothetical protein